MFQGNIGELYWLDARDMFADCLTDGGADRFLLHNLSNNCIHQCQQGAQVHIKKRSD